MHESCLVALIMVCHGALGPRLHPPISAFSPKIDRAGLELSWRRNRQTHRDREVINVRCCSLSPVKYECHIAFPTLHELTVGLLISLSIACRELATSPVLLLYNGFHVECTLCEATLLIISTRTAGIPGQKRQNAGTCCMTAALQVQLHL